MDESSEGRDPEGTGREAQPGGRSSRGPNADPGGEVEPGGLVPPYDGRTTGAEAASSDERAASVERQLADTKTGQIGQTVSPTDEQPVSPDQVAEGEPESPRGVGVSTTRRGEDISDDEASEAGRETVGTKGESERPVGVSDERDSTTVDPQKSQQGAPTAPTGDQGG